MELKKIMTEPEYRKVEAISYSMLSGVSKSPASLISTEKLETPSIIYGSAVDTLTFDGEEAFMEKFGINSGVSPSAIVEKITREVMDVIITTKGEYEGELDEYDELILSTAKANEYGKGWKDETITRKIKDEGGRDLYNLVKINQGKWLLDTLQYQNVRNSAHTLYTHEFTSKWMNCNDDESIVFQFPILWVYKGFKCKSLFDILKFDHKNKIIYPIDLKTSYDHVLGFPKNFIKWMYYLQASFYTEAIKYWKLEYKEFFDYRVDDFRFIIISSTDPFKPLVYKCTPEDLYAGKYGGTIQSTGETVKGFDQLIEDMQWHIANELYSYPREVYQAEGELMLNVF